MKIQAVSILAGFMVFSVAHADGRQNPDLARFFGFNCVANLKTKRAEAADNGLAEKMLKADMICIKVDVTNNADGEVQYKISDSSRIELIDKDGQLILTIHGLPQERTDRSILNDQLHSHVLTRTFTSSEVEFPLMSTVPEPKSMSWELKTDDGCGTWITVRSRGVEISGFHQANY